MAEGFEKEHQTTIKKSIDKILGTKTKLRRAKRTLEEQKKDIFCKLLDMLLMCEERTVVLADQLGIDLTEYDKGFYEIVDAFFEYSFTKKQIKVIHFYLYDRYLESGETQQLVDDNGEPIPLETHQDLWKLLTTIG